MYYTYVLQSQIDKKLYIGFTPDLKSRVQDHNLGKVESTKLRRPLKLVYYEAGLSKEKANDSPRSKLRGISCHSEP